MDVDVEIQLFGLFSYYAAVEIMAALSQITAVAAVAAITVVYGLSFFSSSAVADVAAETASARISHKTSGGLFRRLFFLRLSSQNFPFIYIFLNITIF